jgi:hypothetical protein
MLSIFLVALSLFLFLTFHHFSTRMKYYKQKKAGHSQDRTPDFSVAFKCPTLCATDTSYVDPCHLWLLSCFIIGEREGPQIEISKMRQYKGARRAAIHHMMYRRI